MVASTTSTTTVGRLIADEAKALAIRTIKTVSAGRRDPISRVQAADLSQVFHYSDAGRHRITPIRVAGVSTWPGA